MTVHSFPDSDAGRAAEKAHYDAMDAAYEAWILEQVDEACREHELRLDLRKTFGLPDDTPTTDLF